ncbi:MAG TPA: methylated-DNA--[protein]-cysteine S-methyltransferase [Verrucomicrobiae bacterium]|nr:methylated-DNA--[protein]-cysteine S-methyltransferase [Verrucomicrobiae bacterium]
MNDYERIACVIRYLDERHVHQPDLMTLARHVGLSQHHFHRLFTSWASITPKDFLQCLTLTHAREMLQQGKSILDAALDAGLSSPGRLHDLCVSLEAASPGEVKSGGEGWTIIFGFVDSPFGKCLVGESHRGICHLSFVESSEKVALDTLKAQWPRARLKQNNVAANQLANYIFNRTVVGNSSLRAFVRGTPFQVRVWRALMQVQSGTLVSYGGLAAAVNQPAAARAVGSAVGQNSLAYLIPCHRVIRETGVIGDYRWGQVRKRAMLAWENSLRIAAKQKKSA